MERQEDRVMVASPNPGDPQDGEKIVQYRCVGCNVPTTTGSGGAAGGDRREGGDRRTRAPSWACGVPAACGPPLRLHGLRGEAAVGDGVRRKIGER